jgi:NTP pyrophosphatase (non-canonical NTP hydrolase)
VDLARLTDDVEEVSLGYASRHRIERDDAWFLLKLQEEVGELTQVFLMRRGQARTKGYSPAQIEDMFHDEMADVLCHVLLMARHHGIALEDAVERKWLARGPGPAVTETDI